VNYLTNCSRQLIFVGVHYEYNSKYILRSLCPVVSKAMGLGTMGLCGNA